MASEPTEKVWGMIFSPSTFCIIFNPKAHVNKIIIHSYMLFLLPFAGFFYALRNSYTFVQCLEQLEVR